MVADGGVVIQGFHLKGQHHNGVLKMQKSPITYSSIPETARRLGISVAHYYREMANGKLPKGKKIGGRRVVCDATVDAFLAEDADDE